MFRTTKRIGALGVSILALAIGLVFTQAAFAKTSANVADPAVTACGTLNADNTIYLVTQNISQSGNGDCIVLSGDNDTLDLQGFNVTFTGTPGASTGAGVKVTGQTDVVEGFNSTISGFGVGVLDDGDTTVGDDINFDSNKVGLELTGHTDMWTNFFSANSTAQGVYFKSCDDECSASDFDSTTNAADGVLITGSAGARISLFTSIDNGGNGVHVGCTSGCGGGSEVRVGDAPEGFTTVPAITGNGGDGVFLDKTESGNKDQVFVIKSSSNTGIDLHDATVTCGSNHWVHNDYGTANAGGTSNPACIPNVPF